MSDDEECEQLPHSDLSETNLDFLQPSENWKPRPAFLRMFGPSAEPPLLDLAQEDDDDEPLTLSLAKEAFAHSRRIVVFTGAGVSTAPPANLPTYEEARLSFSRAMVTGADPAWLAFKEKVRAARPTATHRFCAALHQQGRLHRVYTQNVDALHELCLPPHMVVAVHGHALDDSIVCMGEDPWARNPDLKSQLLADFPLDAQTKHPDLCLVLGTRLAVAPFQWFPNLVVPEWCPRFFVNPDCLALGGTRPSPYAANFGGMEDTRHSAPVSLNGRKVSTKVDWTTRRSKYHGHQWLIKMEADAFCNALFSLE
jgi:NAD-dependent SIR2 family protein deacetylase